MLQVENNNLRVNDVNAVEAEALDHVRNIAALPIRSSHVEVMPDAHLGKGTKVSIWR